mmetsp:Transcript_33868/g.40983  ORF Transcript_33868/g.40983 Transcript_33868/m.40983 type:complete len:147 (-) Transcript_33868:220-660(-)
MLQMLYKLMLIASLLLTLLLRKSESLQFPTTRRTFFIKATYTSVIASAACCDGKMANAAIDVSRLKVEQSTNTPGRAPNQPQSGPLAGTSLGFQVGGGPRPENEVRKIDEERYAAVRKATGQGPLFLDGLQREQPDETKSETNQMR